MRQTLTETQQLKKREHRPLRFYERAGSSPLLSWYGLPSRCSAAYFPGCSLPGTRPRQFQQVVQAMSQLIEHLGIVFDCCTRPSHDLGDIAATGHRIEEISTFLQRQGVRTLYVSCPGCYTMFSRYGGDLRVETVYEFLDDSSFVPQQCHEQFVTVHDSCVTRDVPHLHAAVRSLLAKAGVTCAEMRHCQSSGICCGEGAGVSLFEPKLARQWGRLRRKEFDDCPAEEVVAYCGGCVNFLQKHLPTSHVLDYVFEESKMIGKAAPNLGPPLTYLIRMYLVLRYRWTMKLNCTARRNWRGKLVVTAER